MRVVGRQWWQCVEVGRRVAPTVASGRRMAAMMAAVVPMTLTF